MYKRVVVKIGSGVLSHEGKFNMRRIKHIVEQIAEIKKNGIEVALVTSGAVAIGRGMLTLDESEDAIVQKQLLASVGQVKLMSLYADLFGKHGYACAQVLVTKEDFRDRHHYLNMKKCLDNLLHEGVVPVLNENDVIAIAELIFTDNDELAGLVASQLNVDATIILTSVDGVLDGDLHNSKSRVIPKIDFSHAKAFEKYITHTKSASGRGGMHTKFGIARKLAQQGIATHIVNGTRKDVIIEIIGGKSIGTVFVPDRKVSAVKRRLSYSEGLARGVVYINQCVENVFSAKKVASLLPVGVVRVEGAFEKGDVIEMRSKSKKIVGFGIVQYGSQKIKEVLGKKGGRALIHYDRMFLV